jgi:hypothetical protein
VYNDKHKKQTVPLYLIQICLLSLEFERSYWELTIPVFNKVSLFWIKSPGFLTAEKQNLPVLNF